jgi:hypothetical protein
VPEPASGTHRHGAGEKIFHGASTVCWERYPVSGR